MEVVTVDGVVLAVEEVEVGADLAVEEVGAEVVVLEIKLLFCLKMVKFSIETRYEKPYPSHPQLAFLY
ncbi:MAG: hypothetical protein LBG52_04820 [Candidatus Peribacteria bacterium]|nr:hypothetical protein [Candidatus Peribacteria bacterium]